MDRYAMLHRLEAKAAAMGRQNARFNWLALVIGLEEAQARPFMSVTRTSEILSFASNCAAAFFSAAPLPIINSRWSLASIRERNFSQALMMISGPIPAGSPMVMARCGWVMCGVYRRSTDYR